MHWKEMNGRFYTGGRIIRQDEIVQTLVACLVMRKDEPKANYASGRIIFRCASSKTCYKS